jgi:hypothetical protein
MISRPGPLSLDTLSRPRGGHRRFVTSALRAPFTHGLSHRRVPRAPASHHGSLWPNASRCQGCALAKSENRVRPQICRRDCVTIEANTGNCLSSAGLWISQRAPLKITPGGGMRAGGFGGFHGGAMGGGFRGAAIGGGFRGSQWADLLRIGRGQILVVDDEPPIRKLLRMGTVHFHAQPHLPLTSTLRDAGIRQEPDHAHLFPGM